MEKITRAAVGRHAQVGDLYDANRDRFVWENTSKNALKDDGICDGSAAILKNAFKKACDEDGNFEVENTSQTFGIIASNSIVELFKNLGICEELGLSIISGLVNASGSAEYFSSQLCSKGSAHMTLLCTICTVHQEVDGVMAKLNRDCFDSVEATHLVVGIDWGGICSITCHYQNSQFEEDQTVRKKLQSALTAFKEALTLGHDTSLNTLQRDAGVASELTYYVSSDISGLENGSLLTFEDALAVAKSLPSTLLKKNGGKGVPLTYTLLSMNDLRKTCKLKKSEGPSSKKIGSGTARKCFTVIQKVWERQKQINGVVEAFNDNNDFIPKCHFDAATNLKAKFVGMETVFKSELARFIVEARLNLVTGKSDRIENLLLNVSEQAHITQEEITTMRECRRIIDKLKRIKMLKDEGVLCFGKEGSKKSVLQEYKNKNVFLFYMDHRKKIAKHEKWEAQIRCFSKLISAHANDDEVRLIAFDCELHPTKKMCIQYYKEGVLIVEDLVKEKGNDIDKCVVEMAIKDALENISSKRLPLAICCPLSLQNICAKKERQWICKNCKEVVHYGIDDKCLYCKCGKADAFFSKFQCNDLKHGFAFVQFFPLESMEEVLSSFVQEVKETNILIFGPTGVGKSTWINAIANYYAFPTLTAAIQANAIETYIPSTFVNTSEVGGPMQKISVGKENGNEVQEIGHSATQQARAYSISIGKHLITLIDTPGIGDVRGVEHDERNIEGILAYLSLYGDIHGICVMLKPNESRLTTTFKFCITELLTHLHKSAAKNVAFCFTHARSTFYKPGDTLPILEALLTELKGVSISLTQDNQYCFDNEAFRFLACYKKGIKFKPDDIAAYELSWDRAVTETKRLFENLKNQKPHSLRETTTLNVARRIIIELSKPLAEVAATIRENIAAAKTKSKELTNSKLAAKELQTQLYLNTTKLVVKKLAHPTIVCTNMLCVEYMKVRFIVFLFIQYTQWWCRAKLLTRGAQVEAHGENGSAFVDAFIAFVFDAN